MKGSRKFYSRDGIFYSITYSNLKYIKVITKLLLDFAYSMVKRAYDLAETRISDMLLHVFSVAPCRSILYRSGYLQLKCLETRNVTICNMFKNLELIL